MQIEYAYSKDLKPSPFNPNVVNDENLQRLRKSLKRLGNFRPVITREVDGEQQVIAGWHRTMIAQESDEMIPVIHLGEIDDEKAKEIALADNSRYGKNDPDLFGDLLSSLEISVDELSEFIPGYFDETSFNVDFDMDDIDIDESNEKKPSVEATHTTLKFRVPIVDAHVITDKVNKVIDEKGFSDNNSSVEAAGEALLHIFLNQS